MKKGLGQRKHLEFTEKKEKDPLRKFLSKRVIDNAIVQIDHYDLFIRKNKNKTMGGIRLWCRQWTRD